MISFLKKDSSFFLIQLIFGLFFLNACQTSGHIKSCEALNWRDFGKSSAAKGENAKKAFSEQVYICKIKDKELYKNAFHEGFARGLVSFCRTAQGFDFGQEGKDYNGTCSEPQESLFLRGYYKGRLEYLNQQLGKYNKLYAEAEDRLWRKEREYTVVLSEDPEMAKLELSTLDAYREEARSIAQKKQKVEREILQTKRLSEESFF